MTEPTLGELYRLMQDTRTDVRELHKKLDAHAERLTRVEERQRHSNGVAAKWGGAIGAAAGAFVAAVAALVGWRQQ